MDLTQRQLEQFVTVAEELHFGRAAQRLSMSQPPLSQAIARLERGLGVQLLDRGTRSVRLTPAGAAFAQDAARLLVAQQAAVERARSIGRGLAGELRLGSATLLDYHRIPDLLRITAAALPGLHMRLHQDPSAQTLVEMVRSDALDLALVRAPAPGTGDLTVITLGHEHLMAALPTAHPLATESAIELCALREENFVLPGPKTPELTQRIQSACRQAGFTPRDYANADATIGLLSYVAAGLCVALMPPIPFPGVTYRPLRNPSTFTDVTLIAVVRKNAGRAVQRFLELAAQVPE
ncbi:LysR substrate-binding domain-containing protein [Nocardia inohanensis]|uniref:LysR substrate-binding domain-containing protein n=1 Tax=Nocardia inohanensis TaxID=209246 RepID=UPI000834DA56|nr:LysR substrate-binding domain-containing protein [Nocardia inohanensis]